MAAELRARIRGIVPEPCDMSGPRGVQRALEGRWRQLEGRLHIRPGEDPAGAGGVRLVAMSDTHSAQDDIEFAIPDGDIFIHAGDFTR
jgi:hypothetical protein